MTTKLNPDTYTLEQLMLKGEDAHLGQIVRKTVERTIREWLKEHTDDIKAELVGATRSAPEAPHAAEITINEWLPGYWSMMVGGTSIVHVHLKANGEVGVRRTLGGDAYDNFMAYGPLWENQ